MENKAATCFLFGYLYMQMNGATTGGVVVADAAAVDPISNAHMHEISLFLEVIDMRTPKMCVYICGVSIKTTTLCEYRFAAAGLLTIIIYSAGNALRTCYVIA